ncbi:MAG: alkaline phosphatase [Halioglobus sp.]
MKRRNFLKSSLVGLTASQISIPLHANSILPDNPFKLGIASGDMTQSSVVLWTRLVLDLLADDGGLPPAAVKVSWKVSRSADMKNIVRQGDQMAIPQLAHSVHVDLQGLEPDTKYWYQFSLPGYQSELGVTKTLPACNSSPESIRFVTLSCQNYTQGYFVAYDHVVADRPDFVLHLGDYIYDTSFGHSFRKHDTDTDGLLSLADFRKRHALYKTDKHLRRAHAELPFLATLDNHDATTDNDPATLAQRAAAYQAWFEHMPTRGFSGPGSSQFQLHRKIKLGKLMEISLLDTRQYRDQEDICQENKDPSYGFGIYRERCEAFFVKDRSMLGKIQEQWLENTISNSHSSWHAIASTSPFTPYQFYKEGKAHNYIGSWDGYPANRKRITDATKLADSHTVLLSGDVHSFWACDGMQLEDNTERFPAVEFVTSSITADWPEPLAKPVSDNLARNPQVKFYDPKNRGYLLHEVTASKWRTTARAIKDVHDEQSEVFNLAQFDVNFGEPGFDRCV